MDGQKIAPQTKNKPLEPVKAGANEIVVEKIKNINQALIDLKQKLSDIANQIKNT